MNEVGSFAVGRGIWNHCLFADAAPFSRREAWLWLISEAEISPHRRNISGRLIDLARGQLMVSLRHLARMWHWSDSKVRRFLAALVAEGAIDTLPTDGATLITICKYGIYQDVMPAPDADTDAPFDAVTTQPRCDAGAPPSQMRRRLDVLERPISDPAVKGYFVYMGRTHDVDSMTNFAARMRVEFADQDNIPAQPPPKKRARGFLAWALS